jgi:cytoskeletal protein RodZ
VEGTVIGAALASVIAAVASALYTASLRHTSAAVRGVLGGRRSQAAATRGTSARKPRPTGSTAATPEALATLADPGRRRSVVLSAVLGAVAIFVLAGGALTMYEAIAGQALSGGRGTTISQVQREGSEDRRTDDPAPAPTDPAEPSESADPTPTAEPSDTPEAESEPTDEPSAQPSAEPSVQPSATAQTEPSAQAEQPSAAPSEPAPTPR